METYTKGKKHYKEMKRESGNRICKKTNQKYQGTKSFYVLEERCIKSSSTKRDFFFFFAQQK
ncbi:hypothetical protein GLYMA_16G000600v4 [Glycine max]|uniref:Uncharacterized protein n=1 Tax=Glycine max TaxID=3847 RepID=K7MEB3_SOYBN|nr:hypothetical protein GLYMA_16G000600v4 [Glycine max]